MKRKRSDITAFCTASLMIPIIDAAIGENWLAVSAAAMTSVIIRWIFGKRERRAADWTRWLRIIILIMIMAAALDQVTQHWPGNGAVYVVPAMLLVMAGYAIIKGKENTVRTVNVLRWGMYLLILLLAYGAIGSERTGLVVEHSMGWPWSLFAYMLLPVTVDHERGKGSAWLIAAPILASTVGSDMGMSIAELSERITVGGRTAHLESIAACVVTIGCFSVVCFLGTQATSEMKEKEKTIGAVLTVTAAYIVYLVQFRMEWAWIACMMVILWGIYPVAKNKKENRKIVKKELDKRKMKW